MCTARMLLILGAWIAVLPYSGFPSFWKNILFTLTGAVVALISYSIYKNHKIKEVKKPFDNFSENSDFEEKKEEGIEVDVIEENPRGHIEIRREI